MPRRETSSPLQQPSTGTEHGDKSDSHSAASHLRPGVKMGKGGPGQTWLNLTKKDMENYIKSRREAQDKEGRGSLLGWVSRLFRRGGKKS